MVSGTITTITRNYDNFDRLIQEQTPQGTVSYTYDAAGRRKTMIAGSQAQVTYTYDDANRLTKIQQGAQTVTLGYDAANRRTSVTLPNGVVTSYVYDNANQLTNIVYRTASNVVLSSLAYTYDAAGQVIKKFGGFAADPLTGTTSSNSQFDANNRLASGSGYTFGYDANGNISGLGSIPITYTFDVRNRMTAISQSGSVVHSFSYDTFGRRTSKTISGTTTTFLYDGVNPVQETQGGVISGILNGLGIDERYARGEAAGQRYFLTDALGSTVALTDAGASVVQTYAYGPYGNVSASGSSTNSYQYTGRENDGNGYYHYRARYYSPGWQRFFAEDPIGLAGGGNSYAYVGGNPVSNTDPSGLDCISSGGMTTCRYPGGPAFSLPTPATFPDYIGPSDASYHKYDITRSIGCANSKLVMQGLIDNPTPTGFANDASVPIPFATYNPVLTYLTNDLSTGAPIVVNMTGPNSAFSPGYVARTVTNGVAHTYGEGGNFWQSKWGGIFPNYLANELIWGRQMSQIIDGAKTQCGCEN